MLLTKEIPYFDVYNCFNQFSEKIEKLKKRIVLEPLGAQLSNEFARNRVFVSSGEKTALGVDVPLLDASYVYHEKGLRVSTSKIGWFLVLFKDMSSIRFTQSLANSWIVFELPETLLFPGIAQSTIALEFTGDALQQCLFKIKAYFDENLITYSYSTSTPRELGESTIAKKSILKAGSQE